MDVTTRNIIVIGIAALVGLYVGFSYPVFGLLMLIPVLGVIAFVFLRNKSGEKASDAESLAAKSVSPSVGKARIYVMRNAFVAGQQGMNITVDGALNSQIRTKYFLMAEVEPGSHSVEAHMSSQTKASAVGHSIDLSAGDSVLLDAKVSMGALQGKVVFEEIREPAEISRKIAGLTLIAWKDGPREPASIS